MQKSFQNTNAAALLFVLVLAGITMAMPAIQGVSGTPLNGNTITLQGSGFGTKPNAKPLWWDDFEWGKDGDPIDNRTGWITKSDDNLKVRVSDQQAYNGAKSGLANHNNRDWVQGHTRITPSDEVYACMNLYLDPGQLKSDLSWKIFFFNGYFYRRRPSLVWQGFPQNSGGKGNTIVSMHTSNESENDNYIYKYSSCPPFKQWCRMEMRFKLSTPAGASNGLAGCWLDGNPHNSFSPYKGVTRSAGETEQIQSIGFWCGVARPTSGMYVWVDNAYVDNTCARVEIGDNASWENCTRREIQVPEAWSDNAIQIKVNQGMFQTGDQAYVFVVDKDGNRSSTGYPIEIGKGGSTSVRLIPSARMNGSMDGWMDGGFDILGRRIVVTPTRTMHTVVIRNVGGKIVRQIK